MTEAQIKHMVDQFLRWRLPDDFSPDGGISFTRDYNQNTPWPDTHKPIGTNLFTATQAEAMVRHMLEGLPQDSLRPKYALMYLTTADYHCIGRIGGYETLEHTTDPWAAQLFDSAEYAADWKNNESHVRHVPMSIVELPSGKVVVPLVPLSDPSWEDWFTDPEHARQYDEHQREEAEEQYKDILAKARSTT